MSSNEADLATAERVNMICKLYLPDLDTMYAGDNSLWRIARFQDWCRIHITRFLLLGRKKRGGEGRPVSTK